MKKNDVILNNKKLFSGENKIKLNQEILRNNMHIFEPINPPIKTEDSVTGISGGENSPVNGPSSSGNNSDSPVD